MKFEIYDTTLRDGAQSEGINYSTRDKIKIIKKLDELGVTYIEAGWPGANDVDNEVFNTLKNLKLSNSIITAFGSTRKPNFKAKDDITLNNIVKSGVRVATIFGKSWDFHVVKALGTTLSENISMVADSISFLKNNNIEVFFDAEHFFDGYKDNPKYAMQVLKTAKNAGATRIILCDTNGGSLNNEIYKITKTVIEELGKDTIVGVHCHNDMDLAVANSLAAIDAGAVHVQGTINGYGERCGNTNLCSIIPVIQNKRNIDVLGKNLSKLTRIAKEVAEISNISLSMRAPFVGSGAFAHKAGVHASGVRKNSKTYEHINPELVGNTRKFLISNQAGTSSIKEKLENLNFVKDITPNQIKDIIKQIKKLEWKGFAFEGADASFEILVMKVLNIFPKYFDVCGFRIIGDTTKAASTETEASVKVKINDEFFHTVSEGDGPVNALNKALKKALIQKYPQIEHIKLNDFKVRILDSDKATAATTRVMIETTDGKNTWDTVGVSTNIIEASYMAIVDSIAYGLILSEGK